MTEQNRSPMKEHDSDVGSTTGGRGIFIPFDESEDEILRKAGVIKS